MCIEMGFLLFLLLWPNECMEEWKGKHFLKNNGNWLKKVGKGVIVMEMYK